MFSSDKKKMKGVSEDLTMERNRIAKKTVFKGSIVSQGDFRVDGTIEGELITTGRVIIGSEGKIIGKVKCVNGDIEGVFEGHLEVKNALFLKPTANVSGDIYMESLKVEPGAVFNANCKMLSSIKELKTSEEKEKSEGKQNISKVS